LKFRIGRNMTFAVAAGLMGVGIGLSLLGAASAADAAEATAEYNAAAALEDIKLVDIEFIQKRGAMREQGARTASSIVATGAFSGVNVTSGSMLTAITKQAGANARNEFLLELEAGFTKQRIRTQSRIASSQGLNQAAGFRLQGIGGAVSGAASIAALTV